MSWKNAAWFVLDFETSGFNPHLGARVIELGYTIVVDGVVCCTDSILLDPDLEVLDPKVTEITGIKLEDLKGQKKFSEIAPVVARLMEASMLCASYNTPFDHPFLVSEFERTTIDMPDRPFLDPLIWIKKYEKYPWRLSEVAKRHGVAMEGAHRAGADAQMAAHLMLLFMNKMPDDLNTAIALQEQWRVEQEASYQAYLKRKEKEKLAADRDVLKTRTD